MKSRHEPREPREEPVGVHSENLRFGVAVYRLDSVARAVLHSADLVEFELGEGVGLILVKPAFRHDGYLHPVIQMMADFIRVLSASALHVDYFADEG